MISAVECAGALKAGNLLGSGTAGWQALGAAAMLGAAIGILIIWNMLWAGGSFYVYTEDMTPRLHFEIQLRMKLSVLFPAPVRFTGVVDCLAR